MVFLNNLSAEWIRAQFVVLTTADLVFLAIMMFFVGVIYGYVVGSSSTRKLRRFIDAQKLNDAYVAWEHERKKWM